MEEAVGEDAVSQGSTNPVDVGRTLDFQPPGPCGTLIHGENQRKTVPFALDVANQGSWRTFNFKCLKKLVFQSAGQKKGWGVWVRGSWDTQMFITKPDVFLTNAQSRFTTTFLDSVLGPALRTSHQQTVSM